MKLFVKCSTLMLHFLFVLVLLNEKTYASSSITNELSKDEIRLIYEEINFLKDENQNQNVEIAMLKELLVGPQKNDNNPILNENLDNKIGDSLDMMNQHSNKKRPVRLLPPSFFRNEKNETANPIRRFYGPPTNCSELSQLGYTLNGYYQVKSTNISNSNQIENVYCQFKQPDGIFNPSGNEKRISTSSHLQLPKTGSLGTGVHFYAALRYFEVATALKSFVASGRLPIVVIVFSDVGVNIGDAYDSKSGIFKAPKSGVYNFFFKGYLDFGNFSRVALKKNDYLISLMPGEQRESGTPRGPMIQTILELKRGDAIQLACIDCDGSLLSYLSFCGSLLQEL